MHSKELTKHLSDLYNATSNWEILAQIESLLHRYVLNNPHDHEALARLAIAIFCQVTGREEEAIEILQKIPTSSPWYYKAVLIESYMQKTLTEINLELCTKLLSLESVDQELESMKYYMASKYFMYESDESYRKILEKSVSTYRKHVWNLVDLGEAYKNSEKNLCKMLICDALDNVEFIGFSHKPDEDIIDIDYFIKSHISGLYLNTSHLRFIVNDLRPIPRKMPWEK